MQPSNAGIKKRKAKENDSTSQTPKIDVTHARERERDLSPEWDACEEGGRGGRAKVYTAEDWNASASARVRFRDVVKRGV